MGVPEQQQHVSSAPELMIASRGLEAEVSRSDQDALAPGPSTWRARRARCHAAFCTVVCSPGTWRQRILCILFWLAVVAAVVAIFAVLLPKALARPIQQLIAFLTRKLTRGQLMAICFAAAAFLPCTLVLPMMPFIWIAGIAFDFGTAFGLVMSGCIVGMSVQYWVARYLLKDKVERHLLKRRKDGISVALRAVEIAGPWKVVALVRLGPSPYAAMNYIFGVCPTIKYHHYIITSTICTSHHRALSVFFGGAMPTLAQLFSGQKVDNMGAAVYRFVVLFLGIALCVIIVLLAKKALRKITEQELQREAQEAAAAAAAEAAEAGTAGEPECRPRDSLDAVATSKVPLPLAIESKLGDAAAPAGHPAAVNDHRSTGSGSEGDLQVIVVDAANPVPVQDSNLSLASSISLIPAGQQLPPPASIDAGASTTSRASSVSSLRDLLSSRFQRSS